MCIPLNAAALVALVAIPHASAHSVYTRWYAATKDSLVKGTCNAVCADVANDSGTALTCAPTQLAKVNSDANLAGILVAVASDQGSAAAWTCSGTGYLSSGPAIAAKGSMGAGQCFHRSSGTAPTCADAAQQGMLRLCCCIAAGDDAATVCPVSSTDCGANFMWDARSHRCFPDTSPCPSGSWKDTSVGGSAVCVECVHSSSPPGSTTITACVCDAGYWGLDGACTACGSGMYGPLSGQQTEAAACTGSVSSCAAGTFGSSLIRGGASACAQCPPSVHITPAGSMHCVATARWYLGQHRESCDSVCARTVGTASGSCSTSTMPSTAVALRSTLTAIAAEQGTATDAWNCQSIHTGNSGPEKSVLGDCWLGASGCSAVPDLMRPERLCCCPAAGENAATVCPQAESDCGGTTWWDPTSFRCLPSGGCLAGWWKDVSDPAHPTCVMCGQGKYGPRRGQNSEATACTGDVADCPIGTFGASLAGGASACADCPAISGATPAGSTTCEVPLRWMFGNAGESCDAACAAATVGATLACTVESANRMNGVLTNLQFYSIADAIEVDRGEKTVCLTYGFSINAVNPAKRLPASCYIHFVGETASTCAASGTDATRLCCCPAAGEDASTVCPLVASDCKKGTVWTESTKKCEFLPSACTAGERAIDHTRCAKCQAGMFASIPGARYACTDCGVGRFAAADGQTACATCANNTVTGFKTTATACYECGTGKVQDAFRMKCELCQPGKFRDASVANTTARTCEDCGLGTVTGFGSDVCIACDNGAGLVANDAQSECVPATSVNTLCSAGQKITGKTACANCDRGRFTSVSTLAVCNLCPFGRHANVSGASVCSTCPPGFSSGLEPGASVCSKCSDGMVPDTLGAVCEPCGVGKHKNVSVCKTCASGRAAGAQQNVCVQCDAGAGKLPDLLQASCVSATSLNNKCSMGQRVKGPSTCADCERGRFGAEKTLAKCEACPFGRFANATRSTTCHDCPPNSYSGLAVGAAICLPCDAGWIPDALSATCTPCALGTYRSEQLEAASSVCIQCPRTGVNCERGVLVVQRNTWYDFTESAVIDLQTETHACFNDESCVSMAKSTRIRCAGELGYGGPLCGACDIKVANVIRNGGRCVQCPHIAASLIFSLILGLALIAAMFYYVAAQSLDAGDRNDETGVTFKLLMGYNQFLGILGVFKAKGTAVFREIVQWPASFGGGGITSMLFVKCALKSQIYGPFWMTMLAPFVASLLALVFLFPTTKFERWRERLRQEEGWGTEPPRDRAWLISVDRANGFKDSLLRSWCPKKRMTPEDQLEWLAAKRVEKGAVFSPWLRLAAVEIFVLFSLYPSLISSAIGVLRCSVSIGGKRYLVEDYSKECFTPEHIFYIVLGVVANIIYSLGIPLGACIVLCAFHRKIAAGDATVRGSLGFLFAGYSTSRGRFVMAWEVMIMARKFAVTVLSILDLSPTVQILWAILLLGSSFVLTVNVRPYETRVVNWLEEGSILILLFTQVLSLIYLDIETRALASGGNNDDAMEALTTTALLLLNAIAFIFLGGAYVVALVRFYGPKLYCCRPEARVHYCHPSGSCGRCLAQLLDETWVKVITVPADAADNVWVGGAPPDGAITQWQNRRTAMLSLVDPATGRGEVEPTGTNDVEEEERAGVVVAAAAHVVPDEIHRVEVDAAASVALPQPGPTPVLAPPLGRLQRLEVMNPIHTPSMAARRVEAGIEMFALPTAEL